MFPDTCLLILTTCSNASLSIVQA